LPASGNGPEQRIGKLMEGLDARANQWAILGARRGIAVSYPLADRRVLEFCLSLPFERILDSGFSRQPFRNAMRGVLPEQVRLRTDKRANAGVTAAKAAASYGGYLPAAARLGDHPAVRDLFRFEEIEAALRIAVRNSSSPGLPVDFSLQSPPWIFLAAHASRALRLAAHIARVADSTAAGPG
jgi:asparagine synthase (glutamine-hydrolysing)